MSCGRIFFPNQVGYTLGRLSMVHATKGQNDKSKWRRTITSWFRLFVAWHVRMKKKFNGFSGSQVTRLLDTHMMKAKKKSQIRISGPNDKLMENEEQGVCHTVWPCHLH